MPGVQVTGHADLGQTCASGHQDDYKLSLPTCTFASTSSMQEFCGMIVVHF